MSPRMLLILAVLIVVGLGTKGYSGPGASWIGANLGGALYVMFFTFLALAFRPKLSPAVAAAVVLVAVFGVEFLQLWHPPFLEALRSTRVGQLVLGSTFSWFDFPYYVAGAVASVLLAWMLGRSPMARDGAATPPGVRRGR